jgi:hypothetical protein
MRYIKKPLMVEAFKWTGDREQTEDPVWIIEKIKNGMVYFIGERTDKCKMQIKTLEGTMTASIGDWIIKGINNEIYPCKPDIFEKTYEKVDE